MSDAKSIAAAMGGEARGNTAHIPTPGHSPKDRGTVVTLDPAAPGGALVHSFNGGDPLAIKDELRERGLLPERKPNPDIGPWKPVASFEYANADGEVIYRTVRREPTNWRGPGKKPKEFRAERWQDGRWQSGMGECERVPYRLPELLGAVAAGEPVYLVEGEAKADKLATMGFAATAVAFGAKGWRADYAQHFAGAVVHILPDNDEPGRDFARRVFIDLSGVARPSVIDLPGLPESGDIIDWQGNADALRALANKGVAPDWLDRPATDAKPAKRFEFVHVSEMDYGPPDWLIDGLVERDNLGQLFGDPEAGKSFMAVNLGLCVASGQSFHGKAVRRGTVFYIAGEGHKGLARRFNAWGVDRGVDVATVPLFTSKKAAQFLDADSARDVAEAVAELSAIHGDPALIIIDTLARNFGCGDENSTSDMSAFVTAIDELKGRFPGCVALIVHHSGHGEKNRARGAMALKGALDFEYRLQREGDTRRLVNTKMKDAEAPPSMAFVLRNVELPKGGSSAVLDMIDAPERSKPLTKAQALARDTFIEAAQDGGEFARVHLDGWQAAFLSRHTGDNDDSKKRAFRRARAELVEIGLLSVTDDVYQAECPTIIATLRGGGQGRT